MRDKDKVALGRIVMAHREHVIAIQPFGKGLLGTTLRYPYELREPKTYFQGIRSRKMPKDMVSLASHILDTKAGPFRLRKIQGSV
jgi:non-homologous end joining protein Ku